MVEDNILTEAAAHLEAGDLAAAGRLVEGVLTTSPEHAEALQLKARVLLRQRRPGAAARILQRVLVLRPDDADVWIDLGRAHNNDGRLDVASEAFGRAAELAPGSARRRLRRGTAAGRLASAGSQGPGFGPPRSGRSRAGSRRV
jgi:Flp pilus assembly protein TadD